MIYCKRIAKLICSRKRDKYIVTYWLPDVESEEDGENYEMPPLH